MALPNQYARIALNFASADYKIWENIFFYELVGAFPTSFDINAAAASYQALIATPLLATMSADTVYLGLDLRVNNFGVSGDAATNPNFNGSVSATSSPNEVAAIVHLQTATAGGSGRGRSYQSAPALTFITGGRLTSAAITAYNALFAVIQANHTIQTQSWQSRLYSRKTNNMIPITSYTTRALLGTQRRRRPRR